jgi:hypothetical protein
VDTWFYGVVIMAVTLAGLVRPVVVRANRLPWLLLALATISWAVGDQYWSIMFADATTSRCPLRPTSATSGSTRSRTSG